ncbi:heparinase II/III family protein [Cohnella sp.]|uniref:heparinase II/III domain-containing protein n=1 Tax=Cohnella sp. TaxID=1883426 RepID=UPI0035690E42
MLYERYGRQSLKDLLLPAERFAPIPRADDREDWEAIEPEYREMWIALAERYSDYAWPAIRMEDYMAYWRSGDLSRLNLAIFERRSVLGMLVIAECIEGKGRFLDQAINGIFAVCEETTWVTPGHRSHWKVDQEEPLPSVAEHGVELFTAETAKLLAWTLYLLRSRFDAISKRIGERIVREVRNRLLAPYMEHDDYWWLGFTEGVRVNNWNPWCNGAVLTGFLLLEDDHDLRSAGIVKTMRSLDAFIATYPPDGCCDEGPSYWSAAGGGLYECLELLHLASAGRIDAFGERIVREIGAYLYKAHIHDSYFVAFADCDAKASPDGDVVYRYGRSVGDEALARLGASLPKSGKPSTAIWFGMYGHLRTLFREEPRSESGAKAPYVRDAWFENTQVMVAREREGCERGLYVAAKGGSNLESHNHNDVGSFIVFADGCPLLVDLGTEEYKAQTFGPDRYELWYLQSQYHNLPTVRGVLQKSGGEFRAKSAEYRQNDNGAELAMDISDAYPVEAGIERWRRTVRLVRGCEAAVRVEDEFAMSGGIPADIFHSLMTPCEPRVIEEGTILLEYAPNRTAYVRYDCRQLRVRIEPIGFMDSRLRRNWGERMHRIVLEEKTPVAEGSRTLAITIAQPDCAH